MADEKKTKDGKKGDAKKGDAKPKGEARPKAEARPKGEGKEAKKADKGGKGAGGAVSTQEGRPRAPKQKPRLASYYFDTVRPALVEKFGFTNVMQAPRIEKIVINMGVGDAIQDQKLLDVAANELTQIAGQKPSIRRAKKSISNFKLREGVPVGCKVTLRGARMFEFFDRLINVAVPR